MSLLRFIKGLFHRVEPKEKKRVLIHTDGACEPTNPGPGGWCAFLQYFDSDELKGQKTIYGGEPHSTNNKMELMGAIKALQLLKTPCDVTLTTDSQYLAYAFTKGWLSKWKSNGWKNSKRKPVKNQKLWKKLIKQNERHNITWVWERRCTTPELIHVDSKANDMALKSKKGKENGKRIRA